MNEHEAMRRGYLVIDAKDPFGEGLWQVYVSAARSEEIKKRGIGAVMSLVKCVREVLLKPKTMFEGIRTDEDEDQKDGPGWLCYSGVPIHSYDSRGVAHDPYDDEVFLVFVNRDRVAYNWRWEKCDLDDPNQPQRADIRFKKRLVPK